MKMGINKLKSDKGKENSSVENRIKTKNNKDYHYYCDKKSFFLYFNKQDKRNKTKKEV